MHDLVSANFRIVPAHSAQVHSISAASLYGKGVFTTVAVIGGRPFVWEKHWNRLTSNCSRLGIDTRALGEPEIRAALEELIERNGVTSGRARLTIFDTSVTSLWPSPSERVTSLLITTGENRPRPEEFRIAVSPFPINSGSPLSGIKSCNYLDKLIALDEARKHDLHEAVRLNERGEIASAVMANLFWVKDHQLFTPSLATGCLGGTTREFVIENLDCSEVESGPEVLREADAIFLTSAGLGVVRVDAFEGRTIERLSHPITKLLPA